jgi:RND superfamily putative drug exporter
VLRYRTSVWQDPTVLTTAERTLKASGLFTKIAGPLDPGAGVTLEPATLTELHAVLGNPQALPLHPTQAVPVPLATYEAYRATSTLVSTDGRTVGLRAGAPSSTAAMDAVPAVRAALARAAAASGAIASGAAGEAPALYDVSNISNHDVVRIVPVAIIAIGLLLALVMRSLVAPLYLIASVALSYLAALGLAVLLFIELGHSGGLTFLLPFLMFIFLLALGEDYNILVMTRIREESLHHRVRAAVARAVGATGTTVTSAGLVLAGSFFVLGFSGGGGPSGSQIQDIGFGLAIGILMDTFLVRTILVPSTVALLGRWNWWPSALARRHDDRQAPDDTIAPPPDPVPATR